MSTIVSSFVKDRASAAQLPTASLISGAAKVWNCINPNVSTPTISSSFNVTNIQDMGPGQYQTNYTAPLAASGPVTATSTTLHCEAAAWSSTNNLVRSCDNTHAFVDVWHNSSVNGSLA